MNVGSVLLTQAQVVHALILRETRTRFGANQLGFLWALLEPVVFIGTFYALFSLTERSAPSGMNIFGFIVTGLIPYQLFREATSRVTVAVSSNKGLLFYPQVRPLDLVLARTALEYATWFLVLALLMGGEALVTGTSELQNPLFVLFGFACAGALGATVGTVLGALSLYMPSIEKFSGALLRPLFWLSGIFYTANDLPLSLVEYLKYNPVFHCIEFVRDGFYHSYESIHSSAIYPISFVVTLALFGLTFERASRVRIELT